MAQGPFILTIFLDMVSKVKEKGNLKEFHEELEGI
jgi:hypothetical protein